MLRTIHDTSRDDVREMRRQNAPFARWLQSGAAACLIACAPLSGCSGERKGAAAERTQVVYVVQRGWHTGLVLNAADWPRRASFVDARYVEFGWGDAAYYQAEKPTWGMAIASLWPSETVMEVVPLQKLPASPEGDYYAVPVHVSKQELAAIAAAIDKSFVQPLSPTGSTYRVAGGEARFYHAKGTFHAFRTCNRWTSELLQLARCGVRPALMITAGQVMGAAKRCDAESAAHNPRT